jgi:5'-AMP-activated protein kinase catalytic alpha subunit
MIAGKKYNGLIADIWSCGVILYAMICGYLPFEDDNTNILYKKILKGAFELPEFLSRSAKDLLKKILNTDPETRYKIVDIRKHSWMKSAMSNIENQSEGIIVGYNSIPVLLFVIHYPKIDRFVYIEFTASV